MEDWIAEIADEDNKEQMRLWAKQVIKIKLSELDFGERVNQLL